MKKKKKIKIKLWMELLIVAALSGIFYFVDGIPSWLPLAAYVSFWIIWLFLTGAVGIWRARLKKKYKGWIDDNNV
jgi:hypothetical protein